MEPVKPAGSPGRPGTILLAASLLLALAWMLFRIFVGVDFTDEMQYYGEITSLTRTGRLFQADLFIQQLGYFFLVPFFKLHAWLFPDLSYLVLTGRGLLLAGYGVTGWLIWRTLRKLSVAARLAALALHFAWIPFQLFAPSYNTMAHLLLVGLAAGWLRRSDQPASGNLPGLAAGLGVLGFVHPPSGVVMSVMFGLLIWRREGLTIAVRLALYTGAMAGLILAAIRLWHGPEFFADLGLAVEFSRVHSVALAIMHPTQFWGLVALLSAGAGFLAWCRARAAGRWMLSEGWWLPCIILAALTGLWALRRFWSESWTLGYAPNAIALGLLVLLAAWLGEARGRGHPADRGMMWVVSAGLVLFGLGWLLPAMIWGTGFFGFGVFMAVLAGLMLLARPVADGGELALLGLVSGTLFAFSSGNGLHNFGVGCAPFIPFLAARFATGLERRQGRRPLALLPLVLLPTLMIVQGMRHPYREVRGVTGFAPIAGVPAFRGLRASADKLEAIKIYQALLGDAPVAGRRVMVLGPQPWMYFVGGGVPTTPMFFMHFDGIPRGEEMLAERLFQAGEPDWIVVTSGVPAPIHARLQEWLARGSDLTHLPLPPAFKTRFELLTGYTFGDSLLLLGRTPRQP